MTEETTRDDRLKILLIDDDAALLESLATRFSEEGFIVMVAKDGDSGVRKAIEEEPDIILLDIIMPKLDGFSTLERIRQDEWGHDANIVILSNIDRPGYKDEANKHRALAYITKSKNTVDQVVEKVKAAIPQALRK